MKLSKLAVISLLSIIPLVSQLTNAVLYFATLNYYMNKHKFYTQAHLKALKVYGLQGPDIRPRVHARMLYPLLLANFVSRGGALLTELN